ncbi:MAG: calcium/sodium antiporter [Gemmobacter sp.]
MLVAVFFVLGLLGLFFGGDWLVKGASGIARAFRVPPLVIGLTIVGFGTSTPELLVSVQAALGGVPGIAIGNVVGSNTANLLLILGVSAAFGGIAARWAALREDMLWMLVASAALVPVFWDGTVTRIEGMLLVAGIAAFLLRALQRVGSAPEDGLPTLPLWKSAGLTVVGLVVLMVGARLLVDSATEIARWLGVSEAVIGLTIVAVGTSLPELATSLAAALKGQRDIALGNVIGSNIFNVFAILGITAVVTPIPVEGRFIAFDVPVMLAISVMVVVLVARAGSIPRVAGFGFLALYAAYIASMAA